MKIIFIYGPPATGKLTVANELVKITNFKLFHNHLTVDLICSLFEWGGENYSKLNAKFRLEMFKAAAEENMDGLIFTYCYAYPEDDKFVKQVTKLMKKYNVEVCFVQLYCSKKELKKRVKGASRENFDKIKTKKGIDSVLKKWDLYTPISFVKNLRIDNENISAKNVAKKIKEHYKL